MLHDLSRIGLTHFGRDVIRRLNEFNIIIDWVHSSPALVDSVLVIASRPVVVSHTGMYGVCGSARNISDEQMGRIAEKGGLVAIGYWKGAVCDISPEGIVKMLRCAINLLGEDPVALGSDFDRSTATFFDTSEISILTQKMMEVDFTNKEIAKVPGGNSVEFPLKNMPDKSVV